MICLRCLMLLDYVDFFVKDSVWVFPWQSKRMWLCARFQVPRQSNLHCFVFFSKFSQEVEPSTAALVVTNTSFFSQEHRLSPDVFVENNTRCFSRERWTICIHFGANHKRLLFTGSRAIFRHFIGDQSTMFFMGSQRISSWWPKQVF